MVKKAVIPAAGFGTRMLPAAKSVPKEMITIFDRPAIQHVVEEAALAGATDILIITTRGKSAIEDHFDSSPELEAALSKPGKEDYLNLIRAIPSLANIQYIRQKEAKGLGHAIACAKSFAAGEPFLVLLPDDVFLSKGDNPSQELVRAFETTKTSIIGVQEVLPEDISKYGSIRPGKTVKSYIEVLDMVEKPKKDEAYSFYAALGRYLLTPDIFEYLENLTPGAGGELQLTDGLKAQAKSGGLYACDLSAKRFDTGSRLGFLEANIAFAMENAEARAGLSELLREYASQL